MIRRVIIFTAVLTALFAGVCSLSEVWQFGYVGSWGSVGVREGTLWYVWRSTPIHDAPGFYADEASAVNRAMYSIGQDARWRDKELWPWAVRVPAAVGYVLLLIALLRLWKRPAPRWAPRWLIAISMLSIAVWTASQFVTLECNAARVQFHVYDGVVSLYVNDVPFGAAGINRGGRSGWSIHRNPPALTINRGGFLSILGARVTLNLPLVPVIVVTLPAAILFGRSRRIRPGHCKRCRYDLTGNVTGVCSECGLPFVLGPSSETESANSSSPPIDGL